jgi:hypothetical protein
LPWARVGANCGAVEEEKYFSTGLSSHCPDSKRDFTPQVLANQHGKPQAVGVRFAKSTSYGGFDFAIGARPMTYKIPIDSKEVDSRMVVESGRKWSSSTVAMGKVAAFRSASGIQG